MPLNTARLRLRRPVEQDADAIISIASDWEIARRLARVPHRPCRAEGRDKSSVEVERVPERPNPREQT